MYKKNCFLAMLLFCMVYTSAVTLYDGAAGNQTLNQQGWLYVDSSGMASNTASGGTTTLQTSLNNNIQAGYFSHNPVTGSLVHSGLTGITLSRSTGFTLHFKAKVLLEQHASTHRAGFSVILMSSDLRGIELGFWQNEIWAQADNPVFTHSEGIAVDTTNDLHTYALSILDDSYSLYKNSEFILGGSLRNYAAYWTNPFGLGSRPYDIANFIFFGDDTSSAAANASISYAAIDLVAVPEPSGILFFFLSYIALQWFFLYKKQ